MANTYNFPDPFGGADVPTLVGRLISGALAVIGAIFFIMFLWGGVSYMMAGGTAEKVKKAQQTLVNAVIGIVIIALSYTLVSFVIERIAGAASGQPAAQSQPGTPTESEQSPGSSKLPPNVTPIY